MAIVRSNNSFGTFYSSGGYSNIPYDAGTGTGRVLVVVCSSYFERTSGNPQYNGVSMSTIEKQGQQYMYYLVDPAEGTNNISWFSSNTDYCTYFAFILTGCASSPLGVHGKNYQTGVNSISKELGNASSGSFILSSVLYYKENSITWSNNLSYINKQIASNTGVEIASRTLSSAETLTVGCSMNQTDSMNLLGAEFLLPTTSFIPRTMWFN